MHAGDKTEYDSYVCCILAHGAEGKVFGADEVSVETKDIMEALKSVKQLRGKPKMLFFQACQGSAAPAPVHVLDSAAATGSSQIVLDTATLTIPPDATSFMDVLHHLKPQQSERSKQAHHT